MFGEKNVRTSQEVWLPLPYLPCRWWWEASDSRAGVSERTAVAGGEAQSKERVTTIVGEGWATIVRTHWSAWEELTLPSSQLLLWLCYYFKNSPDYVYFSQSGFRGLMGEWGFLPWAMDQGDICSKGSQFWDQRLPGAHLSLGGWWAAEAQGANQTTQTSWCLCSHHTR